MTKLQDARDHIYTLEERIAELSAENEALKDTVDALVAACDLSRRDVEKAIARWTGFIGEATLVPDKDGNWITTEEKEAELHDTPCSP